MKHSANIDRLRIATPCPISWEQMTGDARVRFCDHCQLNVYNISELSRVEAETLIASTEGRICARLYRRADGTLLTKDCPVGLRALRLRVSKRAAAVFAAIVSLAGAALGQQTSAKDGKTVCTPQTKITRTNATFDPAEEALSGTVVDTAGAAVPGAKVTATNTETKERSQAITNDEGRFEFGVVPPGHYSIAINLLGFKPFEIKSVRVEKNQLLNLDIILELDHATETVGVVMAEPGLIERAPGTTIFNEQQIRRLPIPK